jgi:hypothetical protein
MNMETLKLVQKQGFAHYEYILFKETLSVRQCTITGNKEWIINLERLRYQTILEKESGITIKLVSIFLGLCSLLIVIANAADHSRHMNIWFWIALSTVNFWMATAMFFTPVINELRLTGDSEALVFLSDKPSERVVREFINEVINRSKKVLLRKYGTVDSDLPENLIIAQLNWLLDTDVISNEEFNCLKAKYTLSKQSLNSHD